MDSEGTGILCANALSRYETVFWGCTRERDEGARGKSTGWTEKTLAGRIPAAHLDIDISRQVAAYERRGPTGEETKLRGRGHSRQCPPRAEHFTVLQGRCQRGKGSDQRRAPRRLGSWGQVAAYERRGLQGGENKLQGRGHSHQYPPMGRSTV
jgi:hypothetical protein